MSKIATYQLADTPLELSDRLIGTEAIRPNPTPTPLATKNFSLGELLNLFQSNFPSDTLQQVLDTGNTATQNMTINGTINATLIKPTNIEDITGSQGTISEYLSKGVTGISWVPIPVDNLQSVLNAGNTATQNIVLVGNITSTLIIPGNIRDELGNNGTTGQVLTKTGTGIRWQSSSVPGLASVLSVGNSASTSIIIETSQYESNIEEDRIFTRNKSNNIGVSIDSLGSITFTNSVNSAKISSTNISNPNVVFQLPNKPTGTYTLATLSDLSSAVWGNITGTITAQTDLIAYLSGNYYPLSSNPAGYLTQQSVLEYADLTSFPPTGASNTIYIALDTGIGYFWNGTSYVAISTSTSGISGFGIVNRIAKFTPNGSTIGSSRISEQSTGDVKINDSGRAYLFGNTLLSIQRAQTQLDFILGNPLTTQISQIVSENNIGFSIDSRGYLSLKAGTSYTEGLRVLSTGKLQVAQTPDNGTTSDKLLVRDALGNVKQLDYPTTGASVGFEQNFLLMGA